MDEADGGDAASLFAIGSTVRRYILFLQRLLQLEEMSTRFKMVVKECSIRSASWTTTISRVR